MPALEAITETEVREQLEKFRDLDLPESVTRGMIERIIRRKTALVMTSAGLSSLPSQGSQKRELVNNFVASLTIIEVRRMMAAGDVDLLRALSEEERRVSADMKLLEETSETAGYRFDVIGGAEESS